MNTQSDFGYAVVVPVLNGGQIWRSCVDMLKAQQPHVSKVLVVDSGSSDGSDEVAMKAGFEVINLDKRNFDHGGTRQMAAERLQNYEVLVFLTQDAVLERSDTVASLVAAFSGPNVSVAYGRQLPRRSAGHIESHARLFNYTDESAIREIKDKQRLGLKVAFASNSFAAYRTKKLKEVGGFPSKLILSEDMVVTARLLMAGSAVAYVSGARVYHSHDYAIAEEFRRYFDIGVLHQRQSWLLDEMGKPEGEGRRFVRSEISYLLKRAPWLLPSALLRTALKLVGYKLGKHSSAFPLSLRRKLSMHKAFWNDQH